MQVVSGNPADHAHQLCILSVLHLADHRLCVWKSGALRVEPHDLADAPRRAFQCGNPIELESFGKPSILCSTARSITTGRWIADIGFIVEPAAGLAMEDMA